jgi:hypothetical protein
MNKFGLDLLEREGKADRTGAWSMDADKSPLGVVNEEHDLQAGDFSCWLRQVRDAIRHGAGIDVACGECVGCCTSSYFIHIKPEETAALGRIRKELLVAAPGLPKGHVLMGYDSNGRCPMFANGKCSVYEHRPQTCRIYDCRVFTAAGILAGGPDKVEINKRVRAGSSHTRRSVIGRNIVRCRRPLPSSGTMRRVSRAGGCRPIRANW